MLQFWKAEVGQRKDNPFADVLESSGSAVSKASDSKGKKAEVGSIMFRYLSV